MAGLLELTVASRAIRQQILRLLEGVTSPLALATPPTGVTADCVGQLCRVGVDAPYTWYIAITLTTWELLGGQSSGSATVSDEVYGATTWNGVTAAAPSKNAVRDKIEALDATKQPSNSNLTAYATNPSQTILDLLGGSLFTPGKIGRSVLPNALEGSSPPRKPTFTSSFAGADNDIMFSGNRLKGVDIYANPNASPTATFLSYDYPTDRIVLQIGSPGGNVAGTMTAAQLIAKVYDTPPPPPPSNVTRSLAPGTTTGAGNIVPGIYNINSGDIPGFTGQLYFERPSPEADVTEWFHNGLFWQLVGGIAEAIYYDDTVSGLGVFRVQSALDLIFTYLQTPETMATLLGLASYADLAAANSALSIGQIYFDISLNRPNVATA